MRIAHMFSLSFMAAIFTGFALTTCQYSTPITREAPAPAPAVFHLVAFDSAGAFILDPDMPRGDCIEAARANGLECVAPDSLPALPPGIDGPSRITPAPICAALLEAARNGAPDGYARAESNCGAIY